MVILSGQVSTETQVSFCVPTDANYQVRASWLSSASQLCQLSLALCRRLGSPRGMAKLTRIP